MKTTKLTEWLENPNSEEYLTVSLTDINAAFGKTKLAQRGKETNLLLLENGEFFAIQKEGFKDLPLKEKVKILENNIFTIKKSDKSYKGANKALGVILFNKGWRK